MMQRILVLYFLLCSGSSAISQTEIPDIYRNIFSRDGSLHILVDTLLLPEEPLSAMELTSPDGNPLGSDVGLIFDFGPDFQGLLSWQLCVSPDEVTCRSDLSPIEQGVAEANILRMIDSLTEYPGIGVVHYQVKDERGQWVSQSKINIEGTGPFKALHTILEGPFVNQVHPNGGTVSFRTHQPVLARIVIGGLAVEDIRETVHHVLHVNGLQNDSVYTGEIILDDQSTPFTLRTSPRAGTQRPFTFALAPPTGMQDSDDVDIPGVNTALLSRVLKSAESKNAAFIHFNGDLITGNVTSPEDQALQISNWKKAYSALSDIPFYVTYGDREVITRNFIDTTLDKGIGINYFPFRTANSEAYFSGHFSLPENGATGEVVHGDESTVFRYNQSVYSYTYLNCAFVILNTEFLTNKNYNAVFSTDGNLSGYIMDEQLDWLNSTLSFYEEESHIDHIFICQHTPVFPNDPVGGMWYGGKNATPSFRGVPLQQGVLERRDDLLNAVVNNSSKVRAILTSEEGSYHKLHLTSETPIYPENYEGKEITLERSLYQINNGGAGSRDLEMNPWTTSVSNFNSASAMVFFEMYGAQIFVTVIDVMTEEILDQFILVEGKR